MISFRLGLGAAAAGFVLSLVLGLLAGAGVFALVRALVFAGFFFVLASALHIAVKRFLPELLEIAASGREQGPGSRVNIALEEDAPAIEPAASSGMDGFDPAVPIPRAALDQLGEDGYTEKGSEDFFAPSAGAGTDADGVDPVPEGRPAGTAGEKAPPAAREVPAVPQAGTRVALPEGGGGADSVDVLPDLEAMSQAFLDSTREAEQTGGGEDEGFGEGGPFEGGGSPDAAEENVFEVSVSGQSREPAPYTGNKPAVLEGDFQPKDVAQAIQTLLKRDEV